MYRPTALLPDFETDADRALGAAAVRAFAKRIDLTAALISAPDPGACPLEQLRGLRDWSSAFAAEADAVIALIERGAPVTRTTAHLVLRRRGGR